MLLKLHMIGQSILAQEALSIDSEDAHHHCISDVTAACAYYIEIQVRKSAS